MSQDLYPKKILSIKKYKRFCKDIKIIKVKDNFYYFQKGNGGLQAFVNKKNQVEMFTYRLSCGDPELVIAAIMRQTNLIDEKEYEEILRNSPSIPLTKREKAKLLKFTRVFNNFPKTDCTFESFDF